jgi:putative hydrolase of HD superfamily
MRDIANFLFEVGILKKIPRSGYKFLGTGRESVADHSFRVAVIAYLLAENEQKSDTKKVVLMGLFHDLHEARTGDQNYVNKRYVTVDEDKAVRDLAQGLPYGEEIVSLIHEFNSRESLEARLSHDADQLDFILELKRQKDLGNRSAAKWMRYSIKRLNTDIAKRLADEIIKTDSSDWWFKDHEELRVNGQDRIKKHK